MLRILFLTPQPPHPTAGGAAIRNWHLIHAAAAAGHQPQVLTFGTHPRIGAAWPVESFPVPPPRSGARRARDLAARRAPDLAFRLRSAAMEARVRALIESGAVDLVQVEGLEMWSNLPRMTTRTIYDAHNAETTLQARIAAQAWIDRDLVRGLYSSLQTRKLRRYEAAVIRQAAATLAVSETDATQLGALAADRQIDVVPIGVDTAHYAPDAPLAQSIEPFDAVFTGTLNYHANEDAALWLCAEIWPRIRAAKPTARLAIVGRNPTPRIRHYDGLGGICVTGAVPDDRPSMRGAGVYLLPIRFGSGVRVKLLNAMSMGCAVVATPAACEGVTVTADTDLIVADARPEPYAQAVVTLLGDDARRRALGTAGRLRMRAQYDWSICTPKLIDVYRRLEHGHV